MKIEFLGKFEKDLDKINSQKVKDDLAIIIAEAENARFIRDIRNVKKLRKSKIAYRIKLGEYRIGFYYENKVIEFARIVHRKDIYKAFP